MTTPTPEAIEAAAEGIYMMSPWRKNTYDNQTYSWAEIAEYHETFIEEASAALTAAYPLIAAQAKAEALREAAANFPAELQEFAYTRSDGTIDYIDVLGWLKAQAHRDLGLTHCQTCGIDLQYLTAIHILDCPAPQPSRVGRDV